MRRLVLMNNEMSFSKLLPIAEISQYPNGSRQVISPYGDSITTCKVRHINKVETEKSRQASSLRGREREELAL